MGAARAARKRQTAVVLSAFLTLSSVARAAEIVDGVAAIVNDKVITYSEVRDFVQPVVQQLRRNYTGDQLVEQVRKAQMDALNQLIERTLIIEEFKEKGYKIPETVIDQQINDIIADDYGGNRAAFIKTLEAQNLTLAQYRDQVRDRVIVQAMRGHKAQQAVVVSPYKIEKYYQDNLDQYKVGDQIKLRMIFIKRGQESEATSHAAEGGSNVTEQAVGSNLVEAASESNAPPKDVQSELAEEIVAKLDAGDSFESMARVYSEAKEAKEGGDWGWIGKDVLRKELNAVAFSLKPGQHSRVIETAEGYYILHVDDVKPAHTIPLADVRDDIERILLQQQRAKMQEDWVKDLRGKAYIRLF
ncbi:MAG TPA: peptidyl-prolyl cis-trans isomerase [Verrucomicrobiae bacterium]|nr:peptidyl-prolyl cis-trans isomerase [Verrucomicrobiae bacterium]